MIELKHCAHLAARGLSVVEPLLELLARRGLDHPRSRVRVMSFEVGVLRELAPAPGCRWSSSSTACTDAPGPRRRRRGHDVRRPGLARGLAAVDAYADGLGVHKEVVLPRDEDDVTVGPSDLVRAAHRRWLTVHVYTLRAENRFLPTELRSGPDPPRPATCAPRRACCSRPASTG